MGTVGYEFSTWFCVGFLLAESVIHPVLDLFLSKSRQQTTTNLNDCRCLPLPSLPCLSPPPSFPPHLWSSRVVLFACAFALVWIGSPPPCVGQGAHCRVSLLEHKNAVALAAADTAKVGRVGKEGINTTKFRCREASWWRQTRVQTECSLPQHNRCLDTLHHIELEIMKG